MARERGAESPMVIIPSGVDTDVFSNGNPTAFRERFEIPPDVPLIGHVGRIIPAKNLSYLAEAVAQTLEKRSDAWFVVVGDGEARPTMQAILEDHGLGDRTVFTGALHGEDLVNAYTAMDLFVFASKTDTQGLVLVEALSAGTPVVALDAPGARDVIRPECGRLVEEDSPPAAYSKCLLDLLQDTKSLNDLASAAPERANDFDRKVCAEQMLEVYSELIDEFAAASRGDAQYTVWELLQNRFAAEWDLLREKGNLVAVAFDHNDSD
jgi:glycosyltransferase involved in cell wall biosynthesis